MCGIPHEAYTKLKISYLPHLRKDCFIYIPKECRLSGIKLLSRAQNGIFYRYTNSHSIHKYTYQCKKHTIIVNAWDVQYTRFIKNIQDYNHTLTPNIYTTLTLPIISAELKSTLTSIEPLMLTTIPSTSFIPSYLQPQSLVFDICLYL